MHADQVDISAAQVEMLIAEQVPQLAGNAVVRVDSLGTVNAIFRIGNAWAARFPLVPGDADASAAALRRSQAAATEFHRLCPVASPRPVHLGTPGHGYPGAWTVQTWIAGAPATPTAFQQADELADDLAALVRAIRSCDTAGRQFEGDGRGGALPDHDAWVATCIERSEGLVDTQAMRRLWADLRTLPHTDPDAMCHTDLIPANLLLAGARLCGVLDTGGFSAADPALDLVCAWHLFARETRRRFRDALGCSDLQWQRGRAWAFQQAAGLVWYYAATNPPMAELGRVTMSRVLAGD